MSITIWWELWVVVDVKVVPWGPTSYSSDDDVIMMRFMMTTSKGTHKTSNQDTFLYGSHLQTLKYIYIYIYDHLKSANSWSPRKRDWKSKWASYIGLSAAEEWGPKSLRSGLPSCWFGLLLGPVCEGTDFFKGHQNLFHGGPISGVHFQTF